MATPLLEDENFLLSCASRVDAGKRNGQQVRDVRIDITGLSEDGPLPPELSIAILERASERLNHFLNMCVRRTPPTISEEEGKAFEDNIACMLDTEFGTSRLTIRRFVIVGAELSVETLMALEMPVSAPLQ